METLEELKKRFEGRISHHKNGCWIWAGSKDKVGYGYFSIKGKTLKSHRVSYYIYKGEIPEKMMVCHSCDMPSCVNPEHLWIGTAKQNMQDRDRKMRGLHGERNHRSIMGEHLVIYIRNSTLGVSELARNYGVSIGAISGIKKRRTWKHVNEV